MRINEASKQTQPCVYYPKHLMHRENDKHTKIIGVAKKMEAVPNPLAK